MSKPSPPAPHPERFAPVQYRAADLFGRYMVSYLNALNQAFDGDFVLCLVVGEIAVRNMGRYFENGRNEHLLGSGPDDLSQRQKLMRPCNALSIAESTGIPRETVRRKVAAAVERGWVMRNARGHLYLTDQLACEFMPMTGAHIQELVVTGRALEQLFTEEAALEGRRRRTL